MSEKSRLLPRSQSAFQATAVFERNSVHPPASTRPPELAGVPVTGAEGELGHSLKHISLSNPAPSTGQVQPAGPSQFSPGKGTSAPAPKVIQASGAGQQFSSMAVPSGGGVIQCQGKKGDKKKQPKEKSQSDKDRQKKAGLNLGGAMNRTGASNLVNRKGHTGGNVANISSSRGQTHSHGDKVAITGAKNKAVQVYGVSRHEFQSSAQRKGNVQQSKDERLDQRDLENQKANFIRGKKMGSKKKGPVVERDPEMERIRQLQLSIWAKQEGKQEEKKEDTDTDDEQSVDVADEHPEVHKTEKRDESDDEDDRGGGGFGNFGGNEILVGGY